MAFSLYWCMKVTFVYVCAYTHEYKLYIHQCSIDHIEPASISPNYNLKTCFYNRMKQFSRIESLTLIDNCDIVWPLWHCLSISPIFIKTKFASLQYVLPVNSKTYKKLKVAINMTYHFSSPNKMWDVQKIVLLNIYIEPIIFDFCLTKDTII